MDKKQPIKEREIKTYPPDKYKNYVERWAELNKISNSKVVSITIKQFFDTLPADQRAQLMAVKLPPRQSKHSY
jgi:hypothetical protein